MKSLSGLNKFFISFLIINFILPFTFSVNAEITDKKEEVNKVLIEEFKKRSNINFDSYILGAGDSVFIEIDDIPELSGEYLIAKDGTLYLPRLNEIFVEGLTLNELNLFLTEEYKNYILDPVLYLRIVRYRRIAVYVGGEISRPGFYALRGSTKKISISDEKLDSLDAGLEIGRKDRALLPSSEDSGFETYGNFAPTLFDALRNAGGITPFSNISNIKVIRLNSISNGGGKKETTLSLVDLITTGDQSQNIRLQDGDSIFISKSDLPIREQILKTGQTNLNPKFINVFISGRVNLPGTTKIPTGSVLNQAINIAGGTKVLKGKIEFLRFQNDGELDRRLILYNPNTKIGSRDNPILMDGDIIRVRNSALTTTLEVANEVTRPFLGIFALQEIFDRGN